MSIPAELKYAKSHEWAKAEADGTVIVGITHHAQELLGDMVFVELPKIGRNLAKNEECAVVESVKSASDIYSPISGEVVAVNTDLESTPEKINQDAYTAWLFRLKPTSPEEMDALLDAAGYEKLIAEEAH